jgi:hypothetical protein
MNKFFTNNVTITMKSLPISIPVVLLSILSLFTSFAEDTRVVVFEQKFPQAGGPELRTRASLSPEKFNKFSKINLAEQNPQISLKEAIAIATKAFTVEEPRLRRSIVLKTQLLTAPIPANPKQTQFLGVPIYAIELQGFLSGDKQPKNYSMTFAILPDKTVIVPTIEQ